MGTNMSAVDAVISAAMLPRRRLLAPRLYKSPISLPERTVGRFSIKHEFLRPGRVAVVSLREAFVTGRAPAFIEIDKPMLVHSLCENRGKLEGVWMTDEPLELRQAGDWVRQSKPAGRVLVAGLGLGVIARWLVARGCEVTIVERERDVLELARVPGAQHVESDIMAYLAELPSWDFDHAFLDTWQGTNESTWWQEVMPMRRLIGQRFGKQRVHAWAEDQMVGQVFRTIMLGNVAAQRALGQEGDNFRCWYYAGFPADVTRAAALNFIRDVGSPAWERRWGKVADAGSERVAAEVAEMRRRSGRA